jgi:hypothetical protein
LLKRTFRLTGHDIFQNTAVCRINGCQLEVSLLRLKAMVLACPGAQRVKNLAVGELLAEGYNLLRFISRCGGVVRENIEKQGFVHGSGVRVKILKKG